MIVAAILLLSQHKQIVNRQNDSVERLLADRDDVFRFDDKALVIDEGYPGPMILQLAERLTLVVV